MRHTELPAIAAAAASDAQLDISIIPGVPSHVDELAARAPDSHRFLRASWFCGGKPDEISTLVARRRDNGAGLALPLRIIGPTVFGARALAGSYWPFRSAALADSFALGDMLALLDDPIAQAAMGPMLRLGPIYESDKLATMLVGAAKLKGWSVLARTVGQSYTQTLDSAEGGTVWPSKLRRKKLRKLHARLDELGHVTLRTVRGPNWSPRVFHDLAQIETNSWVGTKTDRSGAKFLDPDMLEHWKQAVMDPVLADMLAATILYVGDHPVSFSLDLTTGALQYGIASSYDMAFAAYSPGQIVNVHAIDDGAASGVRQIDWGAGDSGYKREIGAVPGPVIQDFLIVRNPVLAAMLRPKWEGAGLPANKALFGGSVALAIVLTALLAWRRKNT